MNVEDLDRLLTPEQLERALEIDIKNSSPEVQNIYKSLLLEEKIKMAKMNNGRPLPVPINEKERMFDISKKVQDLEGAKILLKVERDYEKATTKDGRPPIGGAQE